MMLFSELSFICRAMFGLWTILICLLEIVGFVSSFAVRRYRNAILTVPMFVVVYLMWQVTVCFLYMSEKEQTSAVCLWISHVPYLYWILILLLITAEAIIILVSNIHYSRTFITPLTIERCADELSCGICYWRDNGHVIFSNACMNSLCIQLTGKPLMDGKRMRDAVTDNVMPVGERMWQFSFHDIVYGAQTLHELIATDVSEIYAESDALRSDNDALAQMNEELKTFGLKIDDTVRRQEMLQAKVNIHDEMNRLMLSTIAADIDKKEEMKQIFALWEQNALLLCMETNENRDADAAAQLNDFAQVLGVQIQWANDLTERLTSKQKELFYLAAKEAITNVVKHAQAKTMKISFAETQSSLCCIFENGGNIPSNEVRFTGGLANLAILAEEQNASVSAQVGETFRLSLLFRENE